MIYFNAMSASDDIKKGRVWHKVTVAVAKRDAEAVRGAIQSRYCCGIQSEDISGNRERLEAYFDGAMDASDLERHMEIVAELVLAAGGRRLKLGKIETVPEEDWGEEWRKNWKPVRVSKGLIVCPSWQKFRPKPDETVIYIYPKMAFGTGSHPSTQMCLRLLEKHVAPGARVLDPRVLGPRVIDIGSGSGILAIAAVRLGARRVTAVEMDPQAIENADENCRINRVKSRIRLVCAPFGPKIRGSFDVGVCNMLAHVMTPLLDDITRLLAGKSLIISGISEDSAPEFKRELKARDWRIRKTLKDAEWLGFLADHEAK
jgi:ribosomal protein L11 methyltransferase